MGNCTSTTSIDTKAEYVLASEESTGRSVSWHETCSNEECSENNDPVEVIRNGIIGGSQEVATPFGSRRIIYADYTASGRYLKSIEDFLSSNVYPFYANTHTEASATGAITTHLREEARQIVANNLNAPQDKYAVLFVGTGCTGAIEKMMKVLGIHCAGFASKNWNLLSDLTPKKDEPANELMKATDSKNVPGFPAQKRNLLSDLIPEEERPVVFIGPFEHHSNELPWRYSVATVVVIPEDDDGCPDLNVLEERLNEYKNRRMKIGSFCAGSNVTGICIDTKPYARLLHKHGALAFFDFAGSGAYVDINMSGEDESESMDAIFMSPHKFIGGPGCSGLLVAKRSIFESIDSPTFPGGGTVSFVSPIEEKFENSIEAREDAGTPGIIQAIRTGLVFKVKDMVGCQKIEALEREFSKMVFSKLGGNAMVELVGSNRLAYFDPHKRTTIFSFNIRTPFRANFQASGLKRVHASPNMGLHHSFVVSILNDVYGIQARAGCSCTGPYGHRLFDVDGKTSNRIRDLTEEGYTCFKFGWARVNFNYFISLEEAEFICDAILQIAEHGWKLLPFYKMDPRSGLFTHRDTKTTTKEHSLALFQLSSGTPETIQVPSSCSSKKQNNNTFEAVLVDAARIYSRAERQIKEALGENYAHPFTTFASPLPEDASVSSDDVWWLTPNDVTDRRNAAMSSIGLCG